MARSDGDIPETDRELYRAIDKAAAPKWRRVTAKGQGYTDVSYEYVDDAGQILATVARGGKSGYEFTVYIPGRRGWDAETLTAAKAGVELELGR